MRRLHSWLLCCLIVSTTLAFAGPAAADDEPVIVVEVTEATPEIDADWLRAAIARELHAATVRPTDPRARSARGTVTVDMDRAGGKLTVTYLARSLPTTRRIALPADGAAARDAAVMLAGNLARDEAGELAAELRPPSPAVDAKAPAGPADLQAEELRERAVTRARLQGTLDTLAARESHDRTFAWTTAFLGGFAALVAVDQVDPGYGTPGAALVSSLASTSTMGVAFGAGWITLYAGSSFDKLADAHRKGAESYATEDRWRRFAQKERSLRRATGIVELSLGAVAVAAGSVALATPSAFTSDDQRYALTGVMFGAAVGEALLGIYYLTTEGPVGTALHAYELSTGRIARPRSAWLEHVRIGCGPAGPTGAVFVAF